MTAITNWKSIKTELRKKWGQLTDEELDQTQGNSDQIEDLMTTKYGLKSEEARKQLESFLQPYGVQTYSARPAKKASPSSEAQVNAEGLSGATGSGDAPHSSGSSDFVETGTGEATQRAAEALDSDDINDTDVREDINVDDARAIGAHYQSESGLQTGQESQTRGDDAAPPAPEVDPKVEGQPKNYKLQTPEKNTY